MGPKKPAANFAVGDNDSDMVEVANLKKHLGLADKSFVTLTEKDQAEVGGRLKKLLHTVTDGAFVPLMNFCLGECHVRKLCALKGIVTDELTSSLQLKEEGVKKEEPKEEPKDEAKEEPIDWDVDERMAEADADIEAQVWNTRDRGHGNNKEKSECTKFTTECKKCRTMKNHIYHRVMEKKVKPQFVSQQTGYSVAMIRAIIKGKGGNMSSMYTRTHMASKAPMKKPAGDPQEQQHQQLSPNQQNQGGPPNQSYVRKRKKIDFSIRDLESGADNSGSDQEWHSGKRDLGTPSTCRSTLTARGGTRTNTDRPSFGKTAKGKERKRPARKGEGGSGLITKGQSGF